MHTEGQESLLPPSFALSNETKTRVCVCVCVFVRCTWRRRTRRKQSERILGMRPTSLLPSLPWSERMRAELQRSCEALQLSLQALLQLLQLAKGLAVSILPAPGEGGGCGCEGTGVGGREGGRALNSAKVMEASRWWKP